MVDAASAGSPVPMLDGEGQRKAMQAFRVNQTEKYLNAGQGSAGANAVSESYQRNYRLGYANGYQVGYYPEAKKEELSGGNDRLGHM